jgi:hypothetical protein
MYGVIRFENEEFKMVEDLGEVVENYLTRLRAHVLDNKNRDYEIYVRHMSTTYFYFDSITKELYRLKQI